jgi:type II secretory pathway pseudopilin PulG
MSAEQGKRRSGGRSGISVVETVVAVMIVLMVLAVAMPLVTRLHFTVRRGRDHYVAVSLALATLELARKQDYELLPRMAELRRVVNDQGNYDSAGWFRRTVAVRTDTPSAGLTEVAVDIEIRDRRSGEFRGETEHAASLYTTYLKLR